MSVGGRCYPVKVFHLEESVGLLRNRRLPNPVPNLAECLRYILSIYFVGLNCSRPPEMGQPMLEHSIMILAAQLVLQLDNGIVTGEYDTGKREENAVLMFLPGWLEQRCLY